MINFTVGPVQSSETVRRIGGENVPYFRTSEFSETMFENERLMLRFAEADSDSRVVFLTGSGTAAMEAAVINTLSEKDKILIVNGGSFGKRFTEICRIHGLNYDEIHLAPGKSLKASDLKPYDNKGYTAFLVNLHETSTGVLYDIDLISDFCQRNKLFLIVDAISSFLADEISMSAKGIDLLLTGSQKALACPPGVSIIVMNKRALERVEKTSSRCMYLDLKQALKDGERGQTPFTPAVGVLLQINARLKEIDQSGGVSAERERIGKLANYFRERIKDLPFDMFSESMSNAVTSLKPKNVSAYSIFLILKDEYDIWVCPNGGELADIVFRVGHIGDLTFDDYTALINAFNDMKNRGLL